MTERRIPAGLVASDFGQASGDASAALVSFQSSPIVVARQQTYVVFVLDAAMQASVQSYRWQAEGTTTTTTAGTFTFAPAAEGALQLSVDLLGAGGAVVKNLALDQDVVALHRELETLIERPDGVTPVAADPATSREIVNDVRAYIDDAAPRSADAQSSLNRLVFAIAYADALHTPPPERGDAIEHLAELLGDGASERFAEEAEAGIGLCRVRPQILAMYMGSGGGGGDLITRRELPRDDRARRTVQGDLRTALAALDPALQSDLFNLLRFPKTNLRMAVVLIDALRAQYFPGRDLPAILADEDAAKSLIAQFKDGPLAAA